MRDVILWNLQTLDITPQEAETLLENGLIYEHNIYVDRIVYYPDDDHDEIYKNIEAPFPVILKFLGK